MYRFELVFRMFMNNVLNKYFLQNFIQIKIYRDMIFCHYSIFYRQPQGPRRRPLPRCWLGDLGTGLYRVVGWSSILKHLMPE